MKVTLVYHTANAEDILILSKSTRLNLNASMIDDIKKMSNEDKLKELQYISNTVPSSWEFVDYIFLIEGVSRAFTHQFVRTRTGSYAQQAMRIVNESKYDYIVDDAIKDDLDPDRQSQAYHLLNNINSSIQEAYSALISMGYKPEVARGILPTNISTNILAKFNLRAFSQLVSSRLGGRTQSEYQHVARAMVNEVLKVHPWAEKFLFKKGIHYWDDMEKFAAELPDDKKWQLLKIVDKMKKE